MYKKIHIGVVLTTVFCYTTLFAQNEYRVGVNTETPERTLHVNGSLKVEGLENAANQTGSYSKLLVTNNSGEVEYIDRWTIVPSLQRIRRMQYFTNGAANSTQTLTAGKFEFRFLEVGGAENSSARIQFRLSEKPTTARVDIYTNFEQNYETDGYQFDADPRSIIFTNSDADNNLDVGANIVNGNQVQRGWSGWRELVNQSGTPQVAPGEINELYLSYPAQDLFYRVLIYRMKQGGQTSWIIISEEYSN
jgi:hypothetical protein